MEVINWILFGNSSGFEWDGLVHWILHVVVCMFLCHWLENKIFRKH